MLVVDDPGLVYNSLIIYTLTTLSCQRCKDYTKPPTDEELVNTKYLTIQLYKNKNPNLVKFDEISLVKGGKTVVTRYKT